MKIKKKLLYFSPIPPYKSGIADYSETLLTALSAKFEITVAIDPMRIVNAGLYDVNERDLIKKFRPDLAEKYQIKYMGWDEIDFEAYDHRIYNVGNNPHFHSYMYDTLRNHPGLIILHDVVLHYLTVGRYWGYLPRFFWKMYKMAGIKGVLLHVYLLVKKKHPLHCPSNFVLPMNREVVDSKNKIMVHSKYQRDRLLKSYPHRDSYIKVINQTADLLKGKGMQGAEARKKYGLAKDDIVLSSFGYIADTKQNHVVCKVVKELSRDFPKLRYIMVGEGDYVNQYIDGKIIMKTGFVPAEDFIGLIRASDIVANLRYPSMGETSRAVIQILDEGKPCIVSDDAWFSELPDSVVLKIPCVNPEQHFKEALIDLLTDPAKAQKMGAKGQQLIEDKFAPDKIIEQIVEFLG